MDWFAAMVKRANAASAVTTLLGGTRVYSEEATQGTERPYVTLLDVTQLRPQILKGFDLEFARVQIDVWADSYSSKNAIMEAVLAALVPGGTFNGHIFQRGEIALGPRDIGGEREGGERVFRKSADLIVAHKPA